MHEDLFQTRLLHRKALNRPLGKSCEQPVVVSVIVKRAQIPILFKPVHAAKVESIDDARKYRKPLVAFSPEMQPRVSELERFLLARVYRHQRLIRMDTKARRFITELFNAYAAEPSMLPPRFHGRIGDEGLHRVTCDYIAGMTDRFCQDEYKRLFEPFERV